MSGARWADEDTPLATLATALKAFNDAREWAQFHTPRDLAMALAIEAAEVLELFLWRGDDAVPPEERTREELGDVLITLCNLAARLGVDLMAAAQDKIALNDARYPVERARGSARKHDELGEA